MYPADYESINQTQNTNAPVHIQTTIPKTKKNLLKIKKTTITTCTTYESINQTQNANAPIHIQTTIPKTNKSFENKIDKIMERHLTRKRCRMCRKDNYLLALPARCNIRFGHEDK